MDHVFSLQFIADTLYVHCSLLHVLRIQCMFIAVYCSLLQIHMCSLQFIVDKLYVHCNLLHVMPITVCFLQFIACLTNGLLYVFIACNLDRFMFLYSTVDKLNLFYESLKIFLLNLLV